MNSTDLVALINLLGPVVAKYLTDLVRRFLPSLSVWKIRLLAVGLSVAATWLTGHLSGHELAPWLTAAIGALVFTVNSIHNEIRDFSQDRGLKPGDNAGNLPGGRSTPLAPILIAGLLAAGACSAQTTNAAGATAQNWLNQFLEYVAANGTVSSGLGISCDGRTKGVLFSQSAQIPRLTLQLRRTEVVPGLEHGTLFSWKQDQPDRELVGANVQWHWFSAPPWVNKLQATPVIKTVVWPKFNEWWLQASVFTGRAVCR